MSRERADPLLVYQLQRHGARYPNHDDDYEVAVQRLQSAEKLHDDLKFVRDYEYTLGADDLLAFGAQQCVLVLSGCAMRG